ncbi:MAG: hypothetical protein WC518_03125 [Patescibacteria group bacterium]
MGFKNDNRAVSLAGQKYWPLSVIAEDGIYSLDYLTAAARGGKLKAFKFGDDWLTTVSWWEDFKNKIKKQLEQEVEPHHQDAKWIRRLPHYQKRNGGEVFDFIIGLVLAVFISCWAIFYLLAVSLIPYYRQGSTSGLAFDLQQKKLLAGHKTLTLISQVYSLPISFGLAVKNSPGLSISDEKITTLWQSFVRSKSYPAAADTAVPGDVAGAIEKLFSK